MMALLCIRIPLAAPGERLSTGDRLVREKAATDELCGLIPALKTIPGLVPTLATEAIGNQQILSLTLVSNPQLPLELDYWRDTLGRVVELDPALVSQRVMVESLRLTRLLLARAGIGEPDAIKILRDGLKDLPTRGEAGRFRRELGSQFVLEIFGDREWMQVPLLPTTRIETNSRKIGLLVTEMRRHSFKCRRITEACLVEGQPGFHPDSREVFQCLRVDSASKLEAGRLLHVSMETGTDIRVIGRLVVDSMTSCPVGIEICEVAGFPRP